MGRNAESTPVITVSQVSKRFGYHPVLDRVSMHVNHREIVCVLGISGSGKTTLFNLISGMLEPEEGEIITDSKIGYMMQKDLLMPWKTVMDNIALPLLLQGVDKKSAMAKVSDYLDQFGLSGKSGDYPNVLSGGMRQRAALLRTYMQSGEVLLLDEPFGALDEATREEMQKILLILYGENCDAIKAGKQPPYTMFLVTHEINEAIYVGDRVVGLSQYWNWKEAGHANCPGATIVYDKPSPVFATKNERNFLLFREQKEEIVCTVFNPESCRSYKEYTTVVDKTKIMEG